MLKRSLSYFLRYSKEIISNNKEGINNRKRDRHQDMDDDMIEEQINDNDQDQDEAIVMNNNDNPFKKRKLSPQKDIIRNS